MTTQNAKILDYCSVMLHFHLYFSHFRGICLGFGHQGLGFCKIVQDLQGRG